MIYEAFLAIVFVVRVLVYGTVAFIALIALQGLLEHIVSVW